MTIRVDTLEPELSMDWQIAINRAPLSNVNSYAFLQFDIIHAHVTVFFLLILAAYQSSWLIELIKIDNHQWWRKKKEVKTVNDHWIRSWEERKKQLCWEEKESTVKPITQKVWLLKTFIYCSCERLWERL